MTPRQVVVINAFASAIAIALYAAAVVIFAVYDSSDFGRIERAGLSFELAYFVLYFIYFGLYLGLAIALSRQASVLVRVFLGVAVAICVAPLGVTSFWLGYSLGTLLFLVPGLLLAMVGGLQMALLASVIAIPATGFGVGHAFNFVLAVFADWRGSNPAVPAIRRANVVAATLCACIAGFLAYSHGMGNPPPLGQARVIEQVICGLAGPLIHLAAAVALIVRVRIDETRAPFGWKPAIAGLAFVAVTLVPLAAALLATNAAAGGHLWTAAGTARVLARTEAVQERRKPPTDQPIRVGNYRVDRRPGDVKDGSYDWKSARYLHATARLGSVQTTGRAVEVNLDLTATGQNGLGYVCDDPVEGALAPCRVADFNKDLKNDPRVIRVGLYQGESEIGRIGHTFLMSCRYSFGICKLEFVQPWYEGLQVALIFDRSEREHWADIVRFAIPEIERVISR